MNLRARSLPRLSAGSPSVTGGVPAGRLLVGVLALMGGCAERRVPSTTIGPVTVTYDPELTAIGETLARDAAVGLPVMSRLLGHALPRYRYVMNLYASHADYMAAAKRVGANTEGGSGFASPRSGQAYNEYWPRRTADDGQDILVPMLFRRDSLHELFHVLTYALYPEQRSRPRWFGDGLAEFATEHAFQAIAPELAPVFRDFHLGRWRDADIRNALPSNGQELLAMGVKGFGSEGTYASVYFLIRDLNRDNRLGELLAAAAAGKDPASALLAAGWDALDRRWQRIAAELRQQAAPPASLEGCLDVVNGAYRLISPAGGSSLMVYTDRTYRTPPHFEVSFALLPQGRPRADLYLRYQGHRAQAEYLRLEITPAGLSFYYRQRGKGTRSPAVGFSPPLAVANAPTLVWHRARVSWKGGLEVVIDGREPVRLQPPPARSDQAIRLALGGGDGVVYFDGLSAAGD